MACWYDPDCLVHSLAPLCFYELFAGYTYGTDPDTPPRTTLGDTHTYDTNFGTLLGSSGEDPRTLLNTFLGTTLGDAYTYDTDFGTLLGTSGEDPRTLLNTFLGTTFGDAYTCDTDFGTSLGTTFCDTAGYTYDNSRALLGTFLDALLGTGGRAYDASGLLFGEHFGTAFGSAVDSVD